MTNITPNNDEIDLVNLIRVLWKKKLWIVLSTIICIVAGGTYAYTAPEKWTSTTEIAVPETLEISEYVRLRQDYALATEQKFNINALRSELFNQTIKDIRSNDIKREFFKQLPWYQNEVKGKTELEKRTILSNLMTKQLVLLPVKPTKKDEAVLTKDGRDITFSATTPIIAQDVLTQFIPYVSKKAFQLDVDNFLFSSENTLTTLNFQKEQIEKVQSLDYSSRKGMLNSALKTAKQAGIRDYPITTSDGFVQPVMSLGSTKIPLTNTYLFMMGEKYIKAQLDTLISNGIIYPTQYYLLLNKIEQITPIIAKIKNLKAKPSYSYVSSPSYPITRDAPKRSLILVIAALLGGMLGCIGVLFSELFTTKREEL